MSTLGDIVRGNEDVLFVGRDAELSAFEAWLKEDRAPAILDVHGPGGVGKSTLVRRFENIASDRGYDVTHVDGADLSPTSAGMLGALGGSSLDEVLARLSTGRHLLAIDSFEAMDALTPYVRDQLVASLPANVKVIVAGRHGLDRSTWNEWEPHIRELSIRPLSRADARQYLVLAGVPEGPQLETIAEATHGMPLGLAMAGALVKRGGAAPIAISDWQSVLHELLERSFSELTDPALLAVAEAASVVRRFDADLVAAMVGDAWRPAAFERLVAMPFVELRAHGFALHEEVRGLLEGDLRLRNPTGYQALRNRAGAVYTARLKAAATAAERDWLMLDGLALQQGVGPSLPPPSRASRVEPYQATDRDAVLAVQADFVAEHPAAATMTRDERSADALARILEWPHSEVVVARSAQGRVHGYGFILPLGADTIEMLGDGSQIADALVRWARAERRAIASHASESRTWFSSSIAYGLEDVADAETALGQHGLTLLQRSGVFLMATSLQLYEQLVLAVGGRHVMDLEPPFEGGNALHLIELDIEAYGLEAWTQAVLTGRPPVRRFIGRPLRDAVRFVLVHWDDSNAIASSELAASLEPPRILSAQDVRARIQSVINEPAQETLRLALNAVRYAYVDRVSSVERAAERLHVSRATLFRLLARGTEEIARRLEQVEPPQPET